ncbi:MAG: ABC transporter transmembrane domain-containing protein [Pyrinomonadaceae bacterium]
MHDLQRLLKYLRPHWVKFSLATFAMLASGILQSAIGALIVPIFDQALSRNQEGGPVAQSTTLFNLQEIIPPSGVDAWRVIALLLIVFTIAKGVAEYFSTYLMARIGQSSVLQLRRDLYAHLLTQSASFYERHRTNYLVSRLVSSAAAIETAITSTLRDILRESFTLVVFLSASFYYSWRLTLGSLAIAPVIGVLTARFGRALRNLARESHEGSQRLVDTAQEALSNQNVVKAYRAEGREQQRFGRVAEGLLHSNLRAAKIAGMSPPVIEMIGVAAVVVLLFFGQREILSGRMNSAQFLTFLFFLFSSYDPMRKLSRLHNSMEQALAAARHVWEVMDERQEMIEKPGATVLQPLQSEMALRDVHFDYGIKDAPVLRGISLTVPAGTIVALVGESGSGKSTLTKLLMRFHDPSRGSVLWDGVDARDATLESLRRQTALVSQDVVLFNDTVRYNISYGRPDATVAEIEEASRIAYAHDFIAQLPSGYETIVGERGIFLSGGQRQRLAIARAVLVNAPVLILDEATSALDTESEMLVQKALSNLMSNRTTIVIAHRLSTVRRANAICVMASGRIVEMGTHTELLARGGYYKRLYELQFAEEEDLLAVRG